MSSPDHRTVDRAVGHVLVGLRQFRAENPPVVILLSGVLFAVCRAFLYTLIAGVAGGSQGASFAFIGSCALMMVTYTVAHISDVPMTDRWQGTFFRLARATRNPFGAFALRALPLWVAATALVVTTYLTVGLMAGKLPAALAALAWSPVLLSSVFSTSMLGLFVIAPAIGTRYDTLTYNGATVVLTVLSGAVIPVPDLPVLAELAQILPLTHGIASLRAGLAGDDWITPLLLELAVGVAWGVAAWLFYGNQAVRARRTGSGAMA